MFPGLIWHQDSNVCAGFYWFLKPFRVFNFSTNFGGFWFTLNRMIYFTCEFSCHPCFLGVYTIVPFDRSSVSLALDFGHDKIMKYMNQLTFFPCNFFTVFVPCPYLIKGKTSFRYRWPEQSRHENYEGSKMYFELYCYLLSIFILFP